MTVLSALMLVTGAGLALGPRAGASTGAGTGASTGSTGALTRDGDNTRTGHHDAIGLSAPAVPSVDQLWDTRVDGQVYAQPLAAQDSDGRAVILAATEASTAYGLDPASGDVLWRAVLGSPTTTLDTGCADLLPQLGITGTPVVDPATATAYLVARDTSTGAPRWLMHALDLRDGRDRSGWPIEIKGAATNAAAGQADPTFQPGTQLQRPGLLLLDGIVYAAFGGMCDKPPFSGWVAGVPAAGGAVRLWSTEADLTRTAPVEGGDPEGEGPGAGIWMSGSGLTADPQGHIFVATGNDYRTSSPAPGDQPPGALGNSVVRLRADGDGTVRADQFWAPPDSDALDANDGDLGSGGPVALPDSMGTPSHPHLLLQPSKSGAVVLLDRDALGGQGDGVNTAVDSGFASGPIFGRAAAWPGDGGLVFLVTAPPGTSGFERGAGSALRALSVAPDAGGRPALSEVAISSSYDLGFGSGSPVVTGNAARDGSGVVWLVRTGSGAGTSAELRAWAARPEGAGLTPLGTWPLPRAAKFTTPAVAGGRLFIGTRDGQQDRDPSAAGFSAGGHVLAFGSLSPVAATTPAFPPVTVGTSDDSGLTVLSADRDVVVKALDVLGPATSDYALTDGGPVLPRVVRAGETLSIPLTFSPTAPGSRTATLRVSLDAGVQVDIPLAARGQAVGPRAALTPAPLDFGVVVCGSPTTRSALLRNTGDEPMTLSGLEVTGQGFAVDPVPGGGTTLAPGAAVAVPVRLVAMQPGVALDGALLARSSGGDPGVSLSATCTTPGSLTVDPSVVEMGEHVLDSRTRRTVTITNTGGHALTVTRSKPPSAGAGFAAVPDAAGALLDEGTTVAPGESRGLTVEFRPQREGSAADTWQITTDDGPHDITLRGAGVAPPAAPAASTGTTTGTASTGTTATGTTATATVAHPTAGPGAAPPPPTARPPGRPGSLSLVRSSTGTVRLRWSASASGASPRGWIVRRSGTTRVLGPASHSLVLGKIGPGTPVRISVQAMSAAGRSSIAVLQARAPAAARPASGRAF